MPSHFFTFLLLLVVVVFSVTPAQAQVPVTTPRCNFGTFEVGWPVGDNVRGNDICAWTVGQGFSGEAAVGTFLQMIATLLTVLIVMSGMLGIVWGGYIYMTAGGNASRVQLAKAWIGAALLGITLALTAYTILSTIGPNLVG